MDDPCEQLVALLDKHGSRLHALLTRLTLREDVAEDLMQDLFLKLRQSSGFERARDRVGYAIRTAVHLAFDWRRAGKRKGRHEPLSKEVPGTDPLPFNLAVQREELQRVLNAMGELRDFDRELLVMRYLEEQSYESIAVCFGKTAHQVRGLCHKSLRRLRAVLERAVDFSRKTEACHDQQ